MLIAFLHNSLDVCLLGRSRSFSLALTVARAPLHGYHVHSHSLPDHYLVDSIPPEIPSAIPQSRSTNLRPRHCSIPVNTDCRTRVRRAMPTNRNVSCRIAFAPTVLRMSPF
jgi:hypothetical protein